LSELNFNGATLCLGYLSRILEQLNRDGEITIKGIAPNSISILELGAALRFIAPIPMSLSYVHRTLVGWTARARLQNEVSLWVRKEGRPVFRTKYQHKLLRFPVVIETTKYDDIGLV
jgi:hypothetical protein